MSALIEPSKTGLKTLNWTFFSKLEDKDVWHTLLNSGTIRLEFDRNTYFALEGLVWLSTIFLFRKKQDMVTYLVLEDNKKRASQISRLGFPKLQEALKVNIVSYDELTNTSPTRSPAEIQYFNSQKSNKVSSQAYSDFVAAFSKLFGYRELTDEFAIFVTPFIVSVMEHLSNVGKHSEKISGSGSGLCAYSMPTEKYPFFVFCCTDAGQGILSSLTGKNGISPKDHRDAIVKAILYRKLFPEQGVVGLFETLKFLHKQFGKLQIRTGNCIALIDFSSEAWAVKNRAKFESGINDPTENWLRSMIRFEKCFSFPGTQIRLSLEAQKV